MGMLRILNTKDWKDVTKFLSENYVDNPDEQARRLRACDRVDFYELRGLTQMEEMITRLFTDPANRAERKKALPEANWNSVITRVVQEKATVYNEPANRTADDPRYELFTLICNLDEIMRELNRMLVVHEDVWVQYRVRETTIPLRDPDSALDEHGLPKFVTDDKGEPVYTREPVVDLVPPSLFYAIAHPSDPTLHVATLICMYPGAKADETDAHYRLWTHDETILLDQKLRPVTTPEAWPYGRMPGFIASTRPANGKQRLLALSPAADLVAATKYVWFQSTLGLKESKSQTRQTVVSGDTSEAAMGQRSDSEGEMYVPDGVNVSTIDRGTDVEQFRDNADHAAERASANHGVPPALYNQADATSGAEVALRRLPLRLLRVQQILWMRRIERALAEIMAMVNALDLPEFAFSVAGWSIDFGEVQDPLTEAERDAVFEKRRQLLLTDTIEEERRRNPDLKSDEDAIQVIIKRVRNEVFRVLLTQQLQQLNGGTSSAPGDATSADNGAKGAAAAATGETNGPTTARLEEAAAADA